MPTYALRVQAGRLLALAIKAQEEARGVDCNVLTRRAVERLQDALAVEELRRQKAFDELADASEAPPKKSHSINDMRKDGKAHREALQLLRATARDVRRMTRDSYLVVENTLRFLRSV
jgi:hypothetical protein